MSIESIRKCISNVDNYIMENAGNWRSPAALVALIPIVSLIYQVRITQQFEQKLWQELDLNDRISTSEQFERFSLHFGRCAFIETIAILIFFPQSLASRSVAIRLVRASPPTQYLCGIFNAYQLSHRTVFQSGNVSIMRMARTLI